MTNSPPDFIFLARDWNLISAETKREWMRRARADGWTIVRKGKNVDFKVLVWRPTVGCEPDVIPMVRRA